MTTDNYFFKDIDKILKTEQLNFVQAEVWRTDSTKVMETRMSIDPFLFDDPVKMYCVTFKTSANFFTFKLSKYDYDNCSSIYYDLVRHIANILIDDYNKFNPLFVSEVTKKSIDSVITNMINKYELKGVDLSLNEDNKYDITLVDKTAHQLDLLLHTLTNNKLVDGKVPSKVVGQRRKTPLKKDEKKASK